jgi:hypothetical protein
MIMMSMVMMMMMMMLMRVCASAHVYIYVRGASWQRAKHLRRVFAFCGAILKVSYGLVHIPHACNATATCYCTTRESVLQQLSVGGTIAMHACAVIQPVTRAATRPVHDCGRHTHMFFGMEECRVATLQPSTQ